jgi:hypothetical protein
MRVSTIVSEIAHYVIFLRTNTVRGKFISQLLIIRLKIEFASPGFVSNSKSRQRISDCPDYFPLNSLTIKFAPEMEQMIARPFNLQFAEEDSAWRHARNSGI